MAVMKARDTHLRHVPALDGLRGVAVAVVVAFHAGHLTGGWLGVDVFFVLSGYLISRLLLVEHAAAGRIDLKRFWGRRARRLLPALFCVVVVLAIAERVRHRTEGPAGARWDVIGALTYTSNWVRLRGGAGYWSQFGPPSLFEHFWSLAIEEQFYVFWPLVMIGLTRLRRSLTTLALAGLTVAAAVWSLVWFNHTMDASRVYMGTDTRAYALLVGATIASVSEWKPQLLRWVKWVGPVAGLVLAVAFGLLDGTRLVTYQGGLLGCTVAAALVVVAVTSGPSRFGRLLAVPPLRWLGARSYGIYLWHWPVFAGLGVVGQDSVALWRIAVGVAASLAIAEVSYRLIEMPIRRRGLSVVRWRPTMPVAGVIAAIAAVVAVLPPVAGDDMSPAQARPQGSVSLSTQPIIVRGDLAAASASVPAPDEVGAVDAVSMSTVADPLGPPTRVLVVGDSVGWNLGEQMIADQLGNNLEVRNIAVPGCPPSYTAVRRRRDPGSVPLDFGEECSEQVSAYPFAVNEFRPDVSLVIFGAPLLEQNEIAPDVWSSPCQESFDTWYRLTLEQIVAALGAHNGRVVLVSQAYYRGEVTGRTPLYDDQTDCQNRVAKALADSNPAIVNVDLGAWTCPTRECLVERDGIELRPDGTHFLGPAARMVNGWLFSQVLGDFQ